MPDDERSTTQKLYPELDEELDLIDSASDASLWINSVEPSFNDEFESTQDESIVTEESINVTSNFPKCLLGIAVIVGIILMLLGSFKYNSSNGPVNDSQSSPNVSEIVINLKEEFKNQVPLTFRIVEKEIENVLSNPKAPAIITLFVTADAHQSGLKFAQRIAELFSVPEMDVPIDGAELKHIVSHKAKKQIDDILKLHLSESESKNSLGVVIIDNLQDIPIEAAMMFHSYCDHENAPFKHAVYLFIVLSNTTVPHNTNSKSIDEIVEACLTKAWEAEHEDQVTSLFSRLLGSVVAILPET